ncbi:MAG: hypothetical protein HN383_17395 [Verrucomicrobia bacterium]|jgi:hypothetical protein|nr:hypothetical protein [Verrucomicrobiota bacterium]
MAEHCSSDEYEVVHFEPMDLHPVRSLLQEWGYETEEHEGGFVAKREAHPAVMEVINVRPLNGGVHLFMKTRIAVGQNDTLLAEFMLYLNSVNRIATVLRVYVEGDALVHDAWYPGPFDSEAFGRFFVCLGQDITNAEEVFSQDFDDLVL